MEPNESIWWTVPRAAEYLGVGTRAVQTLVDQGKVTSRLVPGSYVRVLASDVIAVADQCTTTRSA
jgi:excisionase family DNA binding protein